MDSNFPPNFNERELDEKNLTFGGYDDEGNPEYIGTDKEWDKAELHEAVDDFCNNWTAWPADNAYLHEAIDKPETRKDCPIWEEFMEFVNK